MIVNTDILIYDEMRRREEREIDGGLQPLHLPLYRPEHDDEPRSNRSDDDEPSRGVIIIDMNSEDERDG